MDANSNKAAIVFGSVLAIAALLSKSDAEDLANKRRFTVHDSVEMAYFGTVLSAAPDDLDDDGVESPDGRYFLKLTHRGILPQGVTEGTLWLFDTASIKRSVNDAAVALTQPVALARMSAASNGGLGLSVLDAGNTITEPRWAEDGRSITFLGRDGRDNRQLFRLDMQTHTVKALTPPTQDVLAYSRSGSSFAYLAGPDADLQAEQAWVSAGRGIPDVSVGTSIPLMPLLYPHFRGNAYGEPLAVELWQIRGDRAAPVIDSTANAAVKLVTKYDSLVVSLSPDARWVVTTAEGSRSEAGSTPPLQYRLIDLLSGANTALSTSPVAKYQFRKTSRYRAQWSADGNQIALTGFLSSPPAGKSSEPQRCGVALVHIGTPGAWCLATPDQPGRAIVAMNWLPRTGQIHVRYKTFGDSVYSDNVLRRQGSTWVSDRRS